MRALHSHMKKYIAIAVGLFVALPFLVKPSNFVELYAPFYNEELLIASAISPAAEDLELFELSWPKWFVRSIADRYEFDFSSNLDDNQSKLQFILAAVFEHEERNSSRDEIEYVLGFAQRAIDEGVNVNNLAGYGLTALHEAVLFNSTSSARLLISNGANCNVPVAREGKPIDGMWALEMAKYLSVKSDLNRVEIIAYLEDQECNRVARSL